MEMDREVAISYTTPLGVASRRCPAGATSRILPMISETLFTSYLRLNEACRVIAFSGASFSFKYSYMCRTRHNE